MVKAKPLKVLFLHGLCTLYFRCLVSLFWSFVDYSIANIETNIMSKLINIFTESDKLDGPNNYKSWSRHMQNTMIYNELWRDICDGDTSPTKPTNATSLAK